MFTDDPKADPNGVLADYHRWLYRTALGLAPQYSEVDDLVQEGRIAMWRALQAWDGNPTTLTGWLTKAAKRRMTAVVSWSSRRERATGHASGRGTSEVVSVAVLDAPLFTDSDKTLLDVLLRGVFDIEAVAWAYHHGEIVQVLNDLPEQHREYVYFKFWRGYNDTEIARMQSVSTSGLYNRWDRTIRPILREQLRHLQGASA